MTLSIDGFVNVLTQMAIMGLAEKRGLEKAAVIIETEAKRVIGTYDYGWTPLAPSTVAQKANGDTPLLESGAMRDSIEHVVHATKAYVGSNSDIAVFQELGTANIPARSFLGGAAVHKGKEAAHAVVGELHTRMIGL